jgi:nucleotide-binding universal stress UspA family protein
MNTTHTPAPAVVVAVDGSGRGTGAVRYAIHEARARGTGVRMVHVLDDGGGGGHEIMDYAMTEACATASDLDFNWVFGRGPRADELVKATAAGDLLVLGRAPRGSAARPAVGAVTTEVVARAAAPVVVVPADWQARGHDRIVVGIKSFATAGELLAHAFTSASGRHAALRVVHAYDDADAGPVRADAHPGELRSSERRMLEALVRDWSAVFQDVKVETSFVHGEPVRVLVDAAADADVLMTARHHRDLRQLVRLGPVPRAVLGSSDTPVEVVPLTGVPTPAPLVLERHGRILKN